MTAPDRRPKQVACVFCHSTDTEEFSLYGQTLMGSQYYCNHCRSVFEVIRYEDEPDDEGEGQPASKDNTHE
ncbi:hypothetical protein E5F05_00470 (plasmid) [Deinococcus metallilatus]|uniref:PaaD zinc beta ribbon domain-containing protein n=1 Tax=Deinococcus metallilatus TaxID=1211322 RepID=A0AAJ5JZS8_9DEIO|nr:hypothetical protein [Deinococcus metallilatus]MBB5293372.1 hypothetical protein [Deinococcus metallilatus]QBY06474.1 hypothetical protein E5F05_00470 [Deinococcus metallilatus]RXJ17817.1 hypothetical protein ERJ73_00080 [Deinococcus metallilatus]TLK32089.1 hypothetical protein FCS05_01100 [Deinococcus metallilatus]GMA15405.1 hypothetical protein GCM10025871_17360 [Deinococcus metallilatus]